jgi:hypothetical protein
MSGDSRQITGNSQSAGLNRHVEGDERAVQSRKSLPLRGALEDGSFGLHGGVGGPIENAPHLTVALRRPVAVGIGLGKSSRTNQT